MSIQHEHLHSGVHEITVRSNSEYENPFWDVAVVAEVRPESGDHPTYTVYGFHDGLDADGAPVFRIRFRPPAAGRWVCAVETRPHDASLTGSVTVDVGEHEVDPHGELRVTPGEGYRFRRADGRPEFLLGDTMYNLFGAAFSGLDTERLLARRAGQGVNYVRARAQTSPFHPRTPRSSWPVSDFWPWGGSAQKPDLTRFHPAYFAAVDRVFEQASRHGIGFEMILEAWMFEFPFNDRASFDAEIELHWIRYLIARYSAFPQLLIWCPANEYEFYPDGEPKWHRQADRWIARLARAIKEIDPYRHPIGVHNWEQKRSLFERLEHIEEIDVYLVQADWGREMALHGDAALCRYVDRDLRFHAGCDALEPASQGSTAARDAGGVHHGRTGATGATGTTAAPGAAKPVWPTTKAIICAEFGYERAPGCWTLGIFEEFGPEHTRRGQWRAGFSGCPVVHGFNSSWGPHMSLETDSEGTAMLPPFRRFMTEVVDYSEMVPAAHFLSAHSGDREEGTAPLCMSSRDGRTVCVYFPCAGWCELAEGARVGGSGRAGTARPAAGASPDAPAQASGILHSWRIELYDPRSGELQPYPAGKPKRGGEPAGESGPATTNRVESPEGAEHDGEPAPDWIVLLRREGSE